MKGEKMLIGLSYIDRKFIDESENDTVSGKKLHDSSKQEANISMKRTLKRPLLIAAIITLMLFLMGCAAVVLLHLNDLKIGERTYTQHPLYLEDGTKTPATEKVKEIISVQGVAESPNQQAAKEWYEFTKAYNIAQKYPDGIPDFTAPDAYDSYWVPTQELVDKVDEICKKYDLRLAGEGALLLTQAESRIPEILGIDGILKKGTSAQASYVGGRFYECGNFNLDYRVTVDGLQEVKVGYSYADKAYFSSWYLMIDEPESAREWNYTTKDGTELLLVKDAEYGHIFCDREDAFLHIQLGGKMEEVPNMTKAEMEAVAEVLDYSLKSGKVENMHALALELDELYRTPTPVDPEEEARRQAEFEAHERHDSFAALIADMRDNEDYFTRYTGNAYVDFWESMRYCLMDANGDGTEDLILGRDGNVNAIWTMKDGKTIGLQSSWAQGYLCEGYIYELAVLEDGSHFHSYRNLMTGEGLGQVSYYPSDGVWRYQKGNDVKEITEAEAFEIMNSYAHVELPEMKPVKDFPMN